ncbi:MAG: hypothetical protein ACOYEP_12385 [Limnochordia bacterium]
MKVHAALGLAWSGSQNVAAAVDESIRKEYHGWYDPAGSQW